MRRSHYLPKTFKLIEIKKEHICKACGGVIPKGNMAKINSKREYFHISRCGSC